ncbi:MAG: thioredoxin domain-containing protein [Pirellulaceae bacterium]|nr:MAG: thioredoxin domain-containing protein [Pirellulaceae bacterium]
MPGFDQVLQAVAEAWQQRRHQVEEVAAQVVSRLEEILAASPPPQQLDTAILDAAAGSAERQFDYQFGGFGTAPKFPHALMLRFLMRYGQYTGQERYHQMVRLNLDHMASGGIYDHLGGGFARYSVDRRWLVPHFEKMLYDNALLAVTYLEAYLLTHNPEYQRVVRETCDYVLRDMTDPQGGFYSSEDADSEGEEGKFYLWTRKEVEEVLGPDRADLFCRVYDVTDTGNFEGKNILNRSRTWEQCAALYGMPLEELVAEMDQARRQLFERRNQRVRPGRDTKILTSWNSLMIDALCQAGAVLEESRYREAAQKAAHFILTEYAGSDGQLWHCRQRTEGYVKGFLEDYAGMVVALLSLYDADHDENWITHAQKLAEKMLAGFYDNENGGFYYTESGNDSLLVRIKDYQDSSIPSGNGLAAWGLLRLGQLLDEPRYLEAARSTLASAVSLLRQWPLAAGQLLLALDWAVRPTHEVVVVGSYRQSPVREWLREVRGRFWPRRLLAVRDPAVKTEACAALEHLFAGRMDQPVPAFYLCSRYTCQAPARTLDEVRSCIDQAINKRE